MRKDTKTFLSTVLGIPLVLVGVWGLNAANEASVVVFEREQVVPVESEILQPIESVTVVATATSAVPAPKPKPVPVNVVTQPVVVPSPVVVPVVQTPPQEPTPKPVVVKKSRRTRAS